MKLKNLTRIITRRHRRQSGQELIEFGLMLTVLMPMLVGTFVTGFSIVRGIQTNQMDRDIADMYIHGADFSTYPMQQIAQRLAKGLNLQIGSSFANNQQSNSGNSGDGLVTLSKVMWVGTTSEPNCVAAGGAATCTNHDSFVFMERIQFGNGTLSGQNPSSLGNPGAGVSITNAGIIQNYVVDANAALPAASQTVMKNLWQVSGGIRTPLADGRIVFVAETYIQALPLNLGIYKSSGTFARYFF